MGRFRFSLVRGLSFTALFALAAPLVAAPPKVNHFFPAGGQRGQTVEVKAAGEFPDWPVDVWSSDPSVKAKAAEEKGKLSIEIASDAPPGIAWLRLHTKDGASSPQPFMVGALPEVEEKEPNDVPAAAQAVEPKTVINGRLQKSGDSDAFVVSLKQGETFVAALQAHSFLGSPVDSVLQVSQLVERRTLSDGPAQLEAFIVAQNHDAVGLDPRVVFTAPRDGKYLVRVFGFPSDPNSTIGYAGGDAYIYRLTLTTGGYVAGALPLSVPRGASTELQLLGWNLPTTSLRVDLPPASDESSEVAAQAALRAAIAGVDAAPAANVRQIAVDGPSVIAAADISVEKPQEVSLPINVSGRLEASATEHRFRFSGTKGQKIRLSLAGHSLGFPWDPHLSVLNEKGETLVEGDDVRGARDPELAFSPPADGSYFAAVRDLNHHTGTAHVYELTIVPAQPDFTLKLSADNFSLAGETPLEVPVTIDRQDGFAEPIEVTAVDLPAGVTADKVVSEGKGDSAKSVKLILKATPEFTGPFSAPIRIVGTAKRGETPLERTATFSTGKPLAADQTTVWLSASK